MKSQQPYPYVAQAYDMVLPKSGRPVTVLCQSGTDKICNEERHGFRVYLAKQGLAPRDFKEIVKLGKKNSHATDEIKLALSLAHKTPGQTRYASSKLWLSRISVDKEMQNTGIGTATLSILMQLARKYGMNEMRAVFNNLPAGWNHRVDFYNSKGFNNVPEHVEVEDYSYTQDFVIKGSMYVPSRKLRQIKPRLLEPNREVTDMMEWEGKLF